MKQKREMGQVRQFFYRAINGQPVASDRGIAQALKSTESALRAILIYD